MAGADQRASSTAYHPIRIDNERGQASFVIVCDHASNHIPDSLGTLGLSIRELQSHIAWDIGALAVAKLLSRRLDAPLIYPGISRLVVDTNRLADDPDLIVQTSDGVVIPGNQEICCEEREARIAAYHAPFHAGVRDLLDKLGGEPALVAVHSFTPVYQGYTRPWHIGLVFDNDRRLADPVLAGLQKADDLTVGINLPYGPQDRVYRTLETHGVGRGLPTIMFEIRNDMILDRQGQAGWAERLAGLLEAAQGSIDDRRKKRTWDDSFEAGGR